MITKPYSLTYNQRSMLFATLAKVAEANIPYTSLITMLDNSYPKPALEKFTKSIAKGMHLASAGEVAGLFLEWEANLLRAAFHAGVYEASFQWLADYYQQQAELEATLYKNLFPALFLSIAASFILPFPALFLHKITLIQYLFYNIFPITFIAIAHFFIKKQSYKFNIHYWMPWGQLMKKRDMLMRLQLMLQSGVPADEALLLSGALYGKQIANAMSSMALQGKDMVTILTKYQLLDKKVGRSLIHVGEEAGALDQMLKRYVVYIDQKLTQMLTLFANLAPKLIYILIMILMGYTIVKAFSSAMQTIGNI